MDSPELEDILAALQAIVRRAYALGRTESLKRVIEVMENDESSWKPLALKGPSETNVEGPPQAAAAPLAPQAEPVPQEENVPWYLRNRPAPLVRRTH